MSKSEQLYKAREKIQPRSVKGKFQSIRNVTLWITLGIYFLIPWLSWGNQNLILFDVTERKFRILWYTFWPQDFFYLALLILVAALALFFFTTYAGRLWCGYTCPQTVWTKVYMWVEYLVEGDRNKRMSLDKSELTAIKFAKRLIKHSLWLLIAFLTALTFGGYFQPIDSLIEKIVFFNLTNWDMFWIGFFTIATYLNAGWMREQVCMYMCPYARIQSVMFDKDTLTIAYDAKRGESRGARKKNVDPKTIGKGDCIDCFQCVHVCPTGIDIRNGLQMECIGCAACVDACDSVMDKMKYPRGLIRYASEKSLANKKTTKIRPRLVIYGALLIMMSVLLTYLLATRVPLRLEIYRDRTHVYRETTDGLIENTYTLKIMNMSQQHQHYKIKLNSPVKLQYIGPHDIEVNEGEIKSFVVTLLIDPEKVRQKNTTISFNAQALNNPNISINTDSRFIAPLDY